MSPERPNVDPTIGPKKQPGMPQAVVAEFAGTVPIPESQPKPPEPTKQKLFWRKMYQTGEFSPYRKDRGPIKFDALKKAINEAFHNPVNYTKHFGEHVHAIDVDFRGGVDIGDTKERLQRVGALVGMVALFTAFDWGTSEVTDKFFPLISNREKDGRNITLSSDQLRYNARNGAMRKLLEVMNDKYATALGNLVVEKLSGKRGYIHEVADKGADTIQTGFKEMNDLINGATLESYIRIVSQIPVFGALIEQGTSRLAMLQERSQLHTATGKMIYMALGVFIGENRKAMKADDLLAAAARLV